MSLGTDKIEPEIVSQIKEAYPGLPIFAYKDKFKKYELIYTTISHDLLRKIRELVKEETLKGNALPLEGVENKVFDECVLWPPVTEEEKDDLPSGLITNVVKSIQERSYFLDIDIFDHPLRADEYSEIVRDFDFWSQPTQEEIDQLKKDVPFPLFQTTIDRWVFITRPMNRNDMRLIQAALDDQLTLCKAVTVWPKSVEWDSFPAGVVEVLGKSVARISYWTEDATVSEL